ncbi:hypothetical protein POSPLADRAFT_1153941 [Postia placenta MAD-698-R-SB12]|uniref:Major facilitator superfamily (MFS) profile domain-containing protein n=1 Tax=Postia placenta MAD-698-R-SB12 TaxID=670580 RepID=A0A1X6MNY8_9APHY|nr:hypothetical protein POSPLADRAFT_1153941 [Postia placenta MAD-698-R-SB12]OSX58127.1 hypothetical protein POSPLADRAFT_1153941 [Postia placenta MAD-698-R-SB12]
MTGFAAIPLAEDGEQDNNSHLAGVAKILGPRWLQLPTLTIGLLGVQVFWSIEMSYGTPYLRSLGLSKSAVATVFLAGPVSGLIVQPLIGVLADNSKSRFGRRRPYMLAGTCICVVAMLLLGFTRPFASLFTPSDSLANQILAVWLAILALFTIDFSINAVQAVDRALLVDTLPPSDQADGNAWAARMLGIGSVAGYFIGNIDLTVAFRFLGDTELEVLSVLGSFLLYAQKKGSSSIRLQQCFDTGCSGPKKSFRKELRDIWDNMLHLPSVIRQICIIQFFAWLGWFPVLFYTTAFIGELHKRAHPDIAPDDPDLTAEATRLGSRAMFYSALLSLTANVLLPFVVAESAHGLPRRGIWAVLERMKVHLATLWALSHVIFATCMAATLFYSSVAGATFFTALTGFSWSITQWAPFSLLAEAILTSDDSKEDTGSIMLADTRTRRSPDPASVAADPERQFLVGSDDEDEGLEAEEFMGNAFARASHLDVQSDIDDLGVVAGGRRGSGLAAKAGIIIVSPRSNGGIHNIFIVMPQFIMTGIASIIFAFLEPGKSALGGHTPSAPVVNSTSLAEPSSTAATSTIISSSGQSSTNCNAALMFMDEIDGRRLGGIAAAVAFILTVRLVRELRRR